MVMRVLPPAQAAWTFEVEKIMHSSVHRATGERIYIVKCYKGYDSTHNTEEPEEHLICNKLLLSFWKAKKNKAQLERVTLLQEAALAELKQCAREEAGSPLRPWHRDCT